MTTQTTWIPKNPPLAVGEVVVVTERHHKFEGRIGAITKILNWYESPWAQTDRWMSDWFIMNIDGQEEGFLEDEIERYASASP